MELKKIVKEGEVIPNWYGHAWVDPFDLYPVCYPIPLNILFRGLYRIRRFLKNFGRKSDISYFNKTYSDGLNAGREAERNRSKKFRAAIIISETVMLNCKNPKYLFKTVERELVHKACEDLIKNGKEFLVRSESMHFDPPEGKKIEISFRVMLP